MRGSTGLLGCVRNTLQSRMVGIQEDCERVSVCVGGVVSFLAVQVTTLTKHIRYKALIETSTAVATVRVQLHSLCLMSSRQLQFGIKCAVIVSPLRAECKQPSLSREKNKHPKELKQNTHLLHTPTLINVVWSALVVYWTRRCV